MTDREVMQQALEFTEFLWREVALNDYAEEKREATELALRAALAQQEQKPDEQAVEDAVEAAYWYFDARKKGLSEWASAPLSERDAFKAEARKLAKGYFPTRGQEAQQAKREMLAVADAFIRGRNAALAQQAEPVAWIDDSGHPKHRLYRQSATEKRLYGPLRPLYAAPPRPTGLPHCERSCEANAFQIEIRRLQAALAGRA